MRWLPELTELARSNGGLVTQRGALERGIPHDRLSALRRSGAIARVARGVYAVPAMPRELAEPAAFTIACNVVLSDQSAAAWWGVDLPAPVTQLHATAPRTRGRRRDAIPGVRLHRANLRPGDVATVRGVRVTRPLRTALDVARRTSLEHGVAIVDAFIRAGLLTKAEFVAGADAARGPGRARLQLVAMIIDPLSGSILESLCRVMLWRRQLMPPRSQFAFRHPRTGWVGYVDFAWPAAKVVLECDGYEFHASRETFQKDRRRWSAIVRAGWRLAVVTWFDVMRCPEYVVSLVRELTSAPVPTF